MMEEQGPEGPRYRFAFRVFRDMKPLTDDQTTHIPFPIPCPGMVYNDLTDLEYGGSYGYRVMLLNPVAAEPDWMSCHMQLTDYSGYCLGKLIPVKFYVPEHDVATLVHFPSFVGWTSNGPAKAEVYSVSIRGLGAVTD